MPVPYFGCISPPEHEVRMILPRCEACAAKEQKRRDNMAQFLNAVNAVGMLFCLMAVGFFLGRMGWFTAAEKKFISRFVISVCIPFNTLYSIHNNLTREALLETPLMMAAVFCSILTNLAISVLAANLLKLPKERKGVFIAMSFLSNTLFIGLPMCTQLYGDKAVPYIMVFWLVSTMFTQTVALLIIEHSGTAAPKVHSIGGFLKDMFSKPPIVGVVISVSLLALGVKLPAFVMTFSRYMSNCVTPLALIYCGFIIYEITLKGVKLLPGIPVMLFLRMIMGPALCAVTTWLFGMRGLPRNVFIVEAALPVVTQVVVMAGSFGADEEYAATGACLSTICMFITIPILAVLL